MATITTTKETSSSITTDATTTATKPKRKTSPLKGRVKRINDGRKREPESWSEYYLKMYRNIRDKARKYIPDLTDEQIINAFGLNNDDEEKVKSEMIRCCYCNKKMVLGYQTVYPKTSRA
jgi:hypothetical protein